MFYIYICVFNEAKITKKLHQYTELFYFLEAVSKTAMRLKSAYNYQNP